MSKTYYSDLSLSLKAPGVHGLKGSSVLLTGATGLIGSALADALLWLNAEAGFDMKLAFAGRDEARVASRFADHLEGYRFVCFDALRPIAIDGDYDYIVHCASNAHPAAYASAPVETAMANAVGTSALLDASMRCGVRRFLYVSSSEVYGKGGSSGFFREDDFGFIDPLDPRSCYPVSKVFCECLCASYSDEFSLDYVIARPGHVYGPTATSRDSRAHAQFARAAAAGRPVIMKSAGTQLRSYCYVADCTTALITMLTSGEMSAAYNISFPQCVTTVRGLAEAFAKAGGVEIVYENPSDFESRGYNKMEMSALDGGRLLSLGWTGAFTPEQGSSRTVAALREWRMGFLL